MTEFRVWECLVCGFIYDEAKGWPDDGIEPGTRWEDVPEDWLCPDCGVGKADFEMMDIGPSPAEDKTKPESVINTAAGDGIVVIGTGLAAYNLVREFRKLDRTSAITMITRDDGHFYSKPQISTAYTIKKRADELVSAPAETMALDLQLDIRIFTEVTAIDTQAQFVIANGQPLAYSKLVLAWGADCISLPLRGNGLSAVYQVNDLLDYNRFRTALVGKRKVLLIGAGLIGSEYANDLANGGYEVEAIDPLTGPLATLLPKAASQAIQRGLESLGVKYHFGTVAQCIDRHGNGVRATLANGDYIDADLVLSAVGIRSRVQLAQKSGIAINRGIVVNRLLETSAKNVYALGDCAEVNGHVLYYLLPLLACAKSLASTLAGSPARVSYGAMPVKVKTPACPLTVLPVPASVQGEWVVEQQHNDTRALFYDKDKLLRGFALTGAYNSKVTGLAKQIPALME